MNSFERQDEMRIHEQDARRFIFELSFSRDRWLVVVTVVVLCPLRIFVINNGHLPITFLGLFVTHLIGNGRIACYQR
jgi:hypothetical protein